MDALFDALVGRVVAGAVIGLCVVVLLRANDKWWGF